jgi:hypothetical protein
MAGPGLDLCGAPCNPPPVHSRSLAGFYLPPEDSHTRRSWSEVQPAQSIPLQLGSANIYEDPQARLANKQLRVHRPRSEERPGESRRIPREEEEGSCQAGNIMLKPFSFVRVGNLPQKRKPAANIMLR